MYVCMYVYVYTYQRNCTPLHMAKRGNIVESLVDAKADLNAQDSVSALKETRDADRGMRSSRRE
jgi:hypothetical protein